VSAKPTTTSQIVLFLCTGNYYRSRFAEHMFNHLARQRTLPWRAISRGLSNQQGPWKIGPISKYAEVALNVRGIVPTEAHREPIHCHETDLCDANLIIALKEVEHRPMIEKRFPRWVDHIEYWHIHDIDQAHPEDALAELEQLVRALIDKLCAQNVR